MENKKLSCLTRHKEHVELYDYTELVKVKLSDISENFQKQSLVVQNFILLCLYIKKSGIRYPIIINNRNEILSGWKRFLAAKLLGLDEVPVDYYSDSEDTELETIIKENNAVNNRVITFYEMWLSIQKLEKLYKMPLGRKPKGYVGFKGTTDERIAHVLGTFKTTVEHIRFIAKKISPDRLKLADKENQKLNTAYRESVTLYNINKNDGKDKAGSNKSKITCSKTEHTCCPNCQHYNNNVNCIYKTDLNNSLIQKPNDYEKFKNI